MTTKMAIAIVNGMTAGLKGDDLDKAIAAALVKAKVPADNAKAVEAVRNEYVQHAWDVDDLLGDGKTPVTTFGKGSGLEGQPKKARTPKSDEAKAHDAAQRARTNVTKGGKTIKKATKPAVKKEKGPSRVQRMFEHVIAGHSNVTAVELIKKEFGKNVPTNTSSIGWCRSQLHAKTDYAKKYNPKGLKIRTDREAQAAEQTASTKK